MAKKMQHWYDYLWLWPIIYFVLGFFNILFAWLGMNRIITISLRSGNQAVLYSGSKKDAEEFVAAVKNAAKLPEK